MNETWIIVSGKGGVGKSVISSSLGIALARRQLPCCLVDMDMGLRSLDMLLGMQNKVVYDVVDVVNKDCKLKYALVEHAQDEGLYLLPANQVGDIDHLSKSELERILKKLKKRFAHVILDAPAGIGQGVRNALMQADHSILVVTPDDLCIRDAERVIALLEEAGRPRPLLIVNRIIPDLVRSGEMYSPQTVADTLDVSLLGFVPDDVEVVCATNRHESFMELQCPAEEAIDRIAKRFLGEYVPMPSLLPRKRRLFGWLRRKDDTLFL